MRSTKHPKWWFTVQLRAICVPHEYLMFIPRGADVGRRRHATGMGIEIDSAAFAESIRVKYQLSVYVCLPYICLPYYV